MPAISFSSDAFRIKILEGRKCQTIRTPRKNPIKEGDSLHLFYRQRTSECMKLGVAKCLSVSEIEIHDDCILIDNDIPTQGNAKLLTATEDLHNFAVADGFENWEQLIEWFKVSEGKPFKGVLIKWEYPFPVTPESSDFEYQMAWNEALAAKAKKARGVA